MPDLIGRKITFVLPSLNLGGAERQALLLAHHLAHEHEALVQVWGFREPGLVSGLCDQYGLPWKSVHFKLPKTWRGKGVSIVNFARQLRQSSAEILLPYGYEANLACGLSWRLSGARTCIWNQRDEGRHFSGGRIEQLAASQVRTFVSNSSHGSDFLMHQFGIEPEQIKIIFNGIELVKPEMDRSTWRARLGVDEDGFLVCMLANLTKFKDHATLLNAWRQVVDTLNNERKETVLVLAGRFDNTHESLKALAYDLD
ncbi:glycosyltransferase, partial [Chloroflexota bacterium]